MGFLNNIKINSKFKKGIICSVGDMPSQDERDKFLVTQSLANEIPIVVSSQIRFDALKSLNREVDVCRLAKNFTIEMKDKEFPNGVLIDESVSIEMITWIREKDIKIRGGFS